MFVKIVPELRHQQCCCHPGFKLQRAGVDAVFGNVGSHSNVVIAYSLSEDGSLLANGVSIGASSLAEPAAALAIPATPIARSASFTTSLNVAIQKDAY